MNDELLIDVWTSLKGYLDKNQINIVASKYVDVLVDNGITDNALRALRGEDEDLDEAIDYYLDDLADDSDDLDDYNFDE
jgi:hypothetical protein